MVGRSVSVVGVVMVVGLGDIGGGARARHLPYRCQMGLLGACVAMVLVVVTSVVGEVVGVVLVVLLVVGGSVVVVVVVIPLTTYDVPVRHNSDQSNSTYSNSIPNQN